MSYVKIDETAISSADIAEVTAMKIISKLAPAPPFPSIATAALGSTRPAETCAAGRRWG